MTMTDDDQQETFKIVDAILWHEAQRFSAGLDGRLSVPQTHRTMWRLLAKGHIYLTLTDGEDLGVKYCPWWRWRTRRNYAASVQWLIELHRRRMAV